MGLFATPRIRRALLIVGLALHASIALLLGLVSFAVIMSGVLVLYLEDVTQPAWTAESCRIGFAGSGSSGHDVLSR
jgi:hypothetical protein